MEKFLGAPTSSVDRPSEPHSIIPFRGGTPVNDCFLFNISHTSEFSQDGNGGSYSYHKRYQVQLCQPWPTSHLNTITARNQ